MLSIDNADKIYNLLCPRHFIIIIVHRIVSFSFSDVHIVRKQQIPNNKMQFIIVMFRNCCECTKV